MSQIMAFILLISCVLLLITLVVVLFSRRKISLMAGMMVSMATGMLSGLLGGTIIGYYLSGNLFVSTVTSVLVGMIIGAVVGLPLGLLPLLDGLLAGLMGGMMGAMLGDMIPSQQSEQLLKILFIIYVGVHFIILYLLFSSIKADGVKLPIKLFKNPIIAGGLLISIGIIVAQLNTTQYSSMIKHDYKAHHHEQNQAPPNTTTPYQIEVIATDYRYSPGKIVMKKGELYTIILKNTGATEHDINIVNKDVRNDDSSSLGDFHLHAKAGTEVQAKVLAKGKGVFYFYCTIPGHKEAGMIGDLEVM
ncbi:cupredoxin domain-containing protein [Bacillus infantis]|uniref:cupredoxin domain-containing protein n=1 Tax=Bacillus infantis TaxID=324767 RepID=UPI0020057CE0|nr:cupredoxin domain-containing protein [Bacillus infantis]MCK6205738.1 cupredoxin domain-containing protein [Bacillus infantis]